MDERRPDEAPDESEAPVVRPPLNYLGALCASWEDVQRTRLALVQRGLTAEAMLMPEGSLGPAEAMLALERSLGRAVVKELRKLVIWPWLSQFPGLGGVHTARLIAIIGDPMRFPGRPCTRGHISPALPVWSTESVGVSGEGGPCPVVTADGEPCPGTMLPNRRGTGVASLWHYCGLHAVNGHSPRKRKGQTADWNPRARTCVLQPGGIAEQIVRQRVPIYRERYDVEKERLSRERGVDDRLATESHVDPALTEGPQAASWSATEDGPGLRPFQIDALARKIAAKAFLGDLLTAWKRLLSVEDSHETDMPIGREEPLP